MDKPEQFQQVGICCFSKYGERLVKWRKLADWTQERLAEELEILSSSTISRLERGRYKVTPQHRDRLLLRSPVHLKELAGELLSPDGAWEAALVAATGPPEKQAAPQSADHEATQSQQEASPVNSDSPLALLVKAMITLGEAPGRSRLIGLDELQRFFAGMRGRYTAALRLDYQLQAWSCATDFRSQAGAQRAEFLEALKTCDVEDVAELRKLVLVWDQILEHSTSLDDATVVAACDIVFRWVRQFEELTSPILYGGPVEL